MTEIPSIVRERLKASAAGVHPDPDLLTAFAEQALSGRERTAVLDHLARCVECRDVVALATPATQPTALVADRDTVRARKAPWFSWPTLRWGALAACMLIVGTAMLMQRNLKVSETARSVETDAKLQEPELPAAAPLNDAVPRNDKDAGALGHQVTKSKSNSFSANRAITRDEAFEMKKSLALPSTVANSGKVGNEVAASRDMSSRRLDLRAGVVSPPPPPSATPGARQAQAENLPPEGRTSMDLVTSSAPRAANETVEVESMAQTIDTDQPASQKGEALGKAKPPSAPAQYESGAQSTPAAAEKGLASAELRGKLRDEFFHFRTELGRWTISSDGQLQHSVDSGKTWQSVTVAEKATFRALSANGPDLWVGGAAGLLYHSADAGGHWTQMKPIAKARL